MYFPKIFPEDEELQFYQHLKSKILALGDWFEAIENKDIEAAQKIESRLSDIDNFFLNLHEPENFRFDESDNVIIQFERQFEALTSTLVSNGCAGVGEATTFEYYARLDYFKSLQKPEGQQ